jgi:hypothetical protein
MGPLDWVALLFTWGPNRKSPLLHPTIQKISKPAGAPLTSTSLSSRIVASSSIVLSRGPWTSELVYEKINIGHSVRRSDKFNLPMAKLDCDGGLSQEVLPARVIRLLIRKYHQIEKPRL